MVTLKGYTANYAGKSTDTKPTDVEINTVFHALDTGKYYYFDGTQWNEIPNTGGGGGGGDITSANVTAMTGYEIAEEADDIETTDTLNEAIGKLEKGVSDNENNISSVNKGFIISDSQPYTIDNWYNYQVIISAIQGRSIVANPKRLANVTSFFNVPNLKSGDRIDITLHDASTYKYAFAMFNNNDNVQYTWQYYDRSTATIVNKSCYLIIMIARIDDADIAVSEVDSAVTVTITPAKPTYNVGHLIGKEAVFVGDSITAGANTTDGHIYWQLLSDKTGLSSTGEGVAGSCWSVTSDYGSQYSPIASRWNSIPDADIICIFAGTNDYGHNTPLGTIADTTDISFYGAVRYVLNNLINKYPMTRIVLMTPLHRNTYNQVVQPDSTANSAGYNLSDYVNALKEVGALYGVPVIDTYSISGLNPIVTSVYNGLITDNLHPNDKGHELIANRIYSYFLGLI